jgi:hypothetical protein
VAAEGTPARAAEERGPLAARIVARPMTLAPDAAARGWSSRWNVPGGSLLAEGPVGLGWVTIISSDPARAGAVASMSISGRLWRRALATPIAQLYGRAGPMPGYGPGMGFGASPTTDAIDAALQHVANVPLVGSGVFLTIVVCVLGLATMVGPGDYFGLRRLRRSHWSWLTALLWTGVASAAAYYLPRIVRTEPTILHRLSVVDALCAPSSTPGVCTPALVAGVGITGLYSASGGAVELTGVDPASWWRGVSAAVVNPGRGGGGVVPVVQAAAGGALGSERSGPLRRLPVAIWTFRTFFDIGTPPLALTAAAERTPGGVRVTLGNFPAGARVVSAAVLVREGWLALAEDPAREVAPGPERDGASLGSPALGEQGDGSWSATFPADSPAGEAPAAWSPGLRALSARGWASLSVSGGAADAPGALLGLPGPAEHTAAMRALSASGRYAIVHLNVESWPPDFGLSRPATSSHTRVLRLAVPLEDR